MGKGGKRQGDEKAQLVIDANVLFSALIKESTTAALFFKEDFILYAPDFIMEEFSKHGATIAKKTSRTAEGFIQIMHMLHQVITVIPREAYADTMDEAEKISPDSKDALYFALALKLRCGIWSNDKRLKEQDRIRIYCTEEIVHLLGM